MYRSLGNFSFRSSFKTYLYRLARNRSIDFIRKRKRKNNREKIHLLYPSEKTEVSPETELLEKEQRKDILTVIFSLNDRDRSLLLLKDVENLTISEISEITGKPEGTVKSGIHRARLRAARIMLEEGIK